MRPREQVGNWLYGVARRTALEARKRNARRRTHEQTMRETHDSARAAADLWSDLQPLLDAELARLPDKYRTALVLCDLEGRPRKEAARQLAVPEGTLSSRLAAGRKLLAERLRQHGLAVSGGLLGGLLAGHAGAAVPAALAAATARAAVDTGSAAVSAEVAALAEGVIRIMWLTKLKLAAALGLLAALACGLWVSSRAQPARAEKPPVAVILPAAAAPVVQPAPVWKERATLQGHQEAVQVLTFGEKILASGDQDGVVKVWDARAGKEERTLFGKMQRGVIRVVALRDQDRYLGVGWQRGDVFNLALYKLAKNVGNGGSGKGLQLLAVLQDPQVWAGVAKDHVLHLIERPLKGREVPNRANEVYKGHTGVIHALAFSADEQVLATGSADKTVRLWERGKEKEKFRGGHAAEVLAVALTPDGKTLASADKDGLVKLWDAATGKERAALKGHKGPVRMLAVDPAGKVLASAGDDGTVRLWDVAAGKQLAALAGHKGVVHCVAFSSDGRTLASGGADRTVKLWSAEK